MTSTDQRGAISFAEKVLELLEEGRYTATYKYAVLLTLIDVCPERTQASGAPPDMVTTRQLADKIVEIYWPHNGLEESQLEAFLFGADRTQTAKIRTGLWEIQGRRCFYCDSPLRDPAQGQVDHFVPWSRYSDDSLDNLAVADKQCNGFKSSSLAATEHLVRWAQRFAENSSAYVQLDDLAQRAVWDRHAVRSLSVTPRSKAGPQLVPAPSFFGARVVFEGGETKLEGQSAESSRAECGSWGGSTG